jgi:hypothetical protein
MNRQRLALFILLILLLLAIVWSYISYPRPKTVSPLKYPPGSHLTAEKKRVTTVAPQAPRNQASSLRLDLLEQEQSGFKGYRRDIFKPIFVDELKIMKQKAAAVMPALPPAQPAKTVPAPPPIAAPPVTQQDVTRTELARFTFLGFLKKDNRKTIFLAKDKDIILVKKGDTFAGRYQAASITDQALTILVTDTGEEIVIPLIESRQLAAAPAAAKQ